MLVLTFKQYKNPFLIGTAVNSLECIFIDLFLCMYIFLSVGVCILKTEFICESLLFLYSLIFFF